MSSLVERSQIFVGGKWVASRGGTPVEFHNPATGERSGSAVLGSRDDMQSAIEAARASFDSGVWARTTPEERGKVLERAADALQSRFDDLAVAVTNELGCPITFSERAHVPNPIRHIRYYAKLAAEFAYDEIRTDGTNRSIVTKEPVGVVGAITPWNGPISSPSLKIGPALATGCSVVLKAPREAPFGAYALADAFEQAGLPEGVLSIVPADRSVGQLLVDSPLVDKLAFTGSTEAGKSIAAAATATVKRVTLELGGKSAAIVLDDADTDAVVAALVPMAMMVNGQACIAQTRVLVSRRKEREIVEALAAALAALRMGDPLERDTDIGPLVSEKQRDRVTGYIGVGRDEGAVLATGGSAVDLGGRLSGGWFVSPTLLTGVDNSMRVAQEEIFGPVVVTIAYDDDAEAIAIANDSPYGLSGSVWSTDPERALAVARRVRTGMVSINGRPQAYGTPFGGYKQSGIGREMGPEGFASYLETKSIAVA